MKTISFFKASCVAAALLGLPLAQAAVMTKADYKASQTRIAADYKAAKAACAAFSANAKDVCIAQAQGKQKVALAELEFGYTAKPADETKLRETIAESNFAVAKERCDDLAGNPKDVCLQEAKATKTKALAETKLGQKVGEARTVAATDKNDADYKVAAEKCDSLAGDAKAACVAAAKARFGKT